MHRQIACEHACEKSDVYRRPGQLSAEERAQRLAEMTGNATVHDEARWSRQRRARKQDDEEAVANERRAAGNGFSPHSSLRDTCSGITAFVFK